MAIQLIKIIGETEIYQDTSFSWMTDFDNICKEEIRTAAYFLWEAAGRPEGRSEEFWNKAKTKVWIDKITLPLWPAPPVDLEPHPGYYYCPYLPLNHDPVVIDLDPDHVPPSINVTWSNQDN